MKFKCEKLYDLPAQVFAIGSTSGPSHGLCTSDRTLECLPFQPWISGSVFEIKHLFHVTLKKVASIVDEVHFLVDF